MNAKAKKQLDNDKFMTPTEAMRIMKLGKDAFYRNLAAGNIPGAVKFGKQWRIDTEAFWAAVKKEGALDSQSNNRETER